MRTVRDRSGYPLPPEKTGHHALGCPRGHGVQDFWDLVDEVDLERRRALRAERINDDVVREARAARLDRVESASPSRKIDLAVCWIRANRGRFYRHVEMVEACSAELGICLSSVYVACRMARRSRRRS